MHRCLMAQRDFRAVHPKHAGIAAIYVALRYRKEPGSLVAPMRWAFPVALILGSLQTVAFLFLIIRAFVT